jgi:hypothetical protein
MELLNDELKKKKDGVGSIILMGGEFCSSPFYHALNLRLVIVSAPTGSIYMLISYHAQPSPVQAATGERNLQQLQMQL